MAGSIDKAALEARLREIEIKKMGSAMSESEQAALNQEASDIRRRLAMMGAFKGAF